MAIHNGQVIANMTPVQIGVKSTSPSKLYIYNMTNYDDIYLGNNEVTVSNGLELHPHVTYTLELLPNDEIWAVTTTANQDHTVSWLQVV